MSSSWYFTKEELQCSPSTLEDSISYEEEQSRRREGCAFISKAGMKLRFPQLTIATAIVFFHRFFIRHSFKKWDLLIVATACLFLAGKVEETPKKLKDLIYVYYDYRKREPPKPDTKDYEDQRERVTNHERIVLETISFDLTIEHPYKYLLIYVKKLNIIDRNLVQVAWNFVNDSLSTTLCLQFRPGLIAAAALYLAAKFLKNDTLTQSRQMWIDLDTRIEDLEAISNQILELYESTTNRSNQDGVTPLTTPSVSSSASTGTSGSTSSAASSPAASSPPNDMPAHEIKKENLGASSLPHSFQNNYHHSTHSKINIPNSNGNSHNDQFHSSSSHSNNNNHHHHSENNFNGSINSKEKENNQHHRGTSSPSSSSPNGPRSHNEGRRDKESRRYSPY